jgi:hypothetical protein
MVRIEICPGFKLVTLGNIVACNLGAITPNAYTFVSHDPKKARESAMAGDEEMPPPVAYFQSNPPPVAFSA